MTFASTSCASRVSLCFCLRLGDVPFWPQTEYEVKTINNMQAVGKRRKIRLIIAIPLSGSYLTNDPQRVRTPRWMVHAADYPSHRAAEVRWRRRDAPGVLSLLAGGSRGGSDLVATSSLQ